MKSKKRMSKPKSLLLAALLVAGFMSYVTNHDVKKASQILLNEKLDNDTTILLLFENKAD